jgi:type II secretory pathway pseudopilin PulG
MIERKETSLLALTYNFYGQKLRPLDPIPKSREGTNPVSAYLSSGRFQRAAESVSRQPIFLAESLMLSRSAFLGGADRIERLLLSRNRRVFGTFAASTECVKFHKYHVDRHDLAAFTMLEAIVGIAVLGIGAASTIGALTKFNSFAAMSRNATGAYTVVMNQIDLFQSMSPFNPQRVPPQIPTYTESSNNPYNLPTYNMNVGTWTIGYVYKDVNNVTRVNNEWPVYQYKDPNTQATIVVKGTLTITVTDVSAATAPNTYMAVVTVKYDYLNHTRANNNPYIFSMTTIRTSDI